MSRADGQDHLNYAGETVFADSRKYMSSRGVAGIVGYAELVQGDLSSETLEAHIRAANGRLGGAPRSADEGSL